MASCGCTSERKTTGVELMFEGSAPQETICQAIEDAEIFVNCYGEGYAHDLFDVLVRYYACHLLHSWGFAKTITNTSVGPVSEGRQVAGYGDKEGADPYITEFRKLLGGENEFVTAI